MTAFIKQEAMEKAREIEIKANEEFEIEKSKLVRQETDAIDSQYEKKFKQATMSQQITRSTVANKTRLKVLGARQELLDNIFEEAQKKLAEGAKDKGKYQKALKGLLLEGFYALNEPELQVRARKKDYDVVKKAIEEAAKEFKKELGKDITAKIQEDDPLPEGMYVQAFPRRSLKGAANRVLVLAVWLLSVEMERLTSITLLRRDCDSWKSLLLLQYERLYSARILTASSSTKPPLATINISIWEPLHTVSMSARLGRLFNHSRPALFISLRL
jgi:V-type H+-transporting ATPase subunit E